MIRFGLSDNDARATIARYVREHDIRHTVVFYPERFPLPCPELPSAEYVSWPDIIRYVTYYRLLREIDPKTLLVLHECLRLQNRHDLSYNCLRLYLQHTEHRIVIQYLPIMDTIEDLSITIDFDTRSRWKREPLRSDMLAGLDIEVQPVPLTMHDVFVRTDATTRAAYARRKRALIDGIGGRDPHTIPRQLHAMSARAKAASVDPTRLYVGRNAAQKLPNLTTYRALRDTAERTVFEFSHSSIDFGDFLRVTRQTRVDALVSDLRVDRWYFDRYVAWAQRIQDAYAILRA